MSYSPNFAVVSQIKDKFLGNKSVMPDNTIGYLSTDDEQEAHYVCALLNSDITKQFFEDRSSKSKWGISINMIEKIPIPRFKKNEKIHRALAHLSKQAHNTNDDNKIAKIEAIVNKFAKKVLS